MVTGGAGFIGSNLVDALVARGDRVAVIDDLSSGKRENLAGALAAGAQLHELDVRDAPRRGWSLRATCGRSSCSTWPPRSTCAAPWTIRPPTRRSTCWARSTCSPPHARSARAGSSTPRPVVGCTATPSCCRRPRITPIDPLAPYGQSKLAAEGYFELYARLFGLSTVSLRYGNVYGPRQDVHGEAGVVAIFCGCLLEGRTPQVFGDGRQTRDWVDAADVVRANLLAADARAHRPDQHRPRPGDVRARSARRAARSRRRARP